MKTIAILSLFALLILSAFAQPRPVPVRTVRIANLAPQPPLTPTSITLAWDYPTNLLVRSFGVIDQSTGQQVIVTNDVTHFVILRSWDLATWTPVVDVEMTNQVTIPWVNSQSIFVCYAYNSIATSLWSNIVMVSPATNATLKILNFDP